MGLSIAFKVGFSAGEWSMPAELPYGTPSGHASMLLQDMTFVSRFV